MNNKNITFLIILSFFVISSITLVYSSFSTQLITNGEAYVRPDDEIRVTGVELLSATEKAYENYNSNYDKYGVFLYPCLPTLTSTITYKITVTNKSSDTYIISEISEELGSNENITYTIDYEIGEGISGNSTREITVTFKYKDTVTTLPSTTTTNSNIKFTFSIPQAYMLYYDNSNTGIDCDNVQCALDYIKSIQN